MKKIYCEKLNSNDDSYTVELINVDSEFAVSDNDLIFEFETSKANIEIHAEFSGFLYQHQIFTLYTNVRYFFNTF